MRSQRFLVIGSLLLALGVVSCGGSGAGAGATGGLAGDQASSGQAGASGGNGTGGGSGVGHTGDVPPGTLGGCSLFPADNPWNTRIDALPLHARSADYLKVMGTGTGLHPDFGTEWEGAPNGIPFVVVPDTQAMVPISFDYDDESDPGPYPIPNNAPIEGGPDGDGDRHILVIRSGSCILYEIFDAHPGAARWTAGSGAIWHLGKNEVRPDSWTSADAAGLAILPGLVRYDEVYEKKEINHALRVTVSSAQKAFIHPATHSDGAGGHDATHPPMGLRLRLKASFDVSGFAEPIQVILRAMKTYGLMIADSGSNWYISGAPDERWDDEVLASLNRVHGSDFEAVETGPIVSY